MRILLLILLFTGTAAASEHWVRCPRCRREFRVEIYGNNYHLIRENERLRQDLEEAEKLIELAKKQIKKYKELASNRKRSLKKAEVRLRKKPEVKRISTINVGQGITARPLKDGEESWYRVTPDLTQEEAVQLVRRLAARHIKKGHTNGIFYLLMPTRDAQVVWDGIDFNLVAFNEYENSRVRPAKLPHRFTIHLENGRIIEANKIGRDGSGIAIGLTNGIKTKLEFKQIRGIDDRRN